MEIEDTFSWSYSRNEKYCVRLVSCVSLSHAVALTGVEAELQYKDSLKALFSWYIPSNRSTLQMNQIHIDYPAVNPQYSSLRIFFRPDISVSSF